MLFSLSLTCMGLLRLIVQRTLIELCGRISSTPNALTCAAALKRACCEKIYEERASLSRTDQPELTKAFAHARKGDVVAVWKLNRLGRSLPHLIDTVHDLENDHGTDVDRSDGREELATISVFRTKYDKGRDRARFTQSLDSLEPGCTSLPST